MKNRKPLKQIEYIGQILHIRPSYIVSLPEYYGSSQFSSLAFRDNQKNLANNDNKGILSSKAISKLRCSINWLLCAAEEKNCYHKEKDYYFKYKVGFVTLTIPAGNKVPSNYDFKTKLLNPWLTLLRSYYGMKNYVWKLELQKNGMPHIHLATDQFIHYKTLRSSWNNILRKNGLLDDYKTKYFGCTFDYYLSENPVTKYIDKAQRFKAWEIGTAAGWSDPNSTDVHSVRKVKDLAAYICKYMAKNSQALNAFKGRIWGASYEISRANQTKVFIPSTECASEMKQLMSNKIQFKPIQVLDKITQIPRQVGEIFFLRYSDWLNNIKGTIAENFQNSIAAIRGTLVFNTEILTV